jgi:DNA-binding CsgD family transcriptional regulator
MIAESTGERGARASGCALSITRPSLRRPYTLLVAPLPATFGWFLPSRPRAIVFVRNPADVTLTPTAHLRQLYGLTAAEAALTDEIVRGRGLQAAADALGVTLTTARTHLQRVFQKTQTHRQAELVRLITEMRAGFAFDQF